MSDDELEHLRTILSRTYSEPKKKSIREIVRRTITKLLTRPKKAAGKQAEKGRRKEDAA